ncbi:MAG TPA: DUF2378 family protein [Polyangiaceae bacterium]|jgi:uncharacterized protein (TIGR02265 family)|nr:DUF2378 family protein [Polyangiaceae bacterium]
MDTFEVSGTVLVVDSKLGERRRRPPLFVQSVRTTFSASDARFVEAAWDAPFDAEAALRAIPSAATISGMFIAPLALEAKRIGVPLPSARERYLPYRFYPLLEHARVLLETCERVYPNLPARQALRKLGRGAPKALVTSTLGKIVLAGAEGVVDVVDAMAKAYPLNARPSRVEVLERDADRVIVRLEDVHYFLDSHHIGAFEGALRYAGVSGRVRLAMRGRASADFLLEWDSTSSAAPSRPS